MIGTIRALWRVRDDVLMASRAVVVSVRHRFERDLDALNARLNWHRCDEPHRGIAIHGRGM